MGKHMVPLATMADGDERGTVVAMAHATRPILAYMFHLEADDRDASGRDLLDAFFLDSDGC